MISGGTPIQINLFNERFNLMLEIGILCRIMLSTLTVSWKGLISKLDSLIATFLIKV